MLQNSQNVTNFQPTTFWRKKQIFIKHNANDPFITATIELKIECFDILFLIYV